MTKTPKHVDYETRKQNRLVKLGTDNPICGMCGETYWRCIEAHHVADFKRDEATVLLCLNCHSKMSDDQKDHPKFNPDNDRLLDQIGHFLLGLADMLRLIVDKLYSFGLALIERAACAGEAVA